MLLSKYFFFKTSKSSDFSTQIIEFKNLDNSEVLTSDFKALKTSPASLTSLTKMTNTGPFFVEWIMKNPIFH